MNPLLTPFLPLIDFLADVLGKDVEVVLHDVLDINKSIIAIRNNHISGREIGSPATNLVLKILNDGNSDKVDALTNYQGVSAAGKKLRSSTYFIRDENRKIIGMLCVNFDNERLIQFRDYLDTLINFPQEKKQKNPVEHLSKTVDKLAYDSIEEVIETYGVEPERMTQTEKVEIIEKLNEGGVFLLKGAVSKVATRLNVSEATVYRYLNGIKGRSK
ncbi:MAG: PAS domain-containing protein [Spirochaetia bacterium]|jgi:predicted transcriptional regulator YheO|nr:PAS domain-containing protein [Spirochaetia bacterium]MCE1207993.1 PAS domain-containing protein [Spirochaetia bacterium]